MIYLSIAQCACGWPLSDSLKLDDKISIPLVGFAPVSWVRFVSGNYILKENVRIKSESYVRLTLGDYVIKSCKWDQKIT